MAINSVNNIIVMNRGDSFSFDLTIGDENAENGVYVLQELDAIYFGIMDPHQPFEHALVKKKYTYDDCNDDGSLIITITPEDTLDLLPGVYYYSIKLHKLTDNDEEYIDEVITIINKTKLIICD